MTPSGQSDRARAALAGWGIVEVIGDYRGAVIEREVRVELPAVRAFTRGRRSSFTSECLDCGASPHVSPDDHAVAVCLRCGRDKWL